MNPSALFIRRPVATVLLTIGIALTGIAAYFFLPVASLPSVDFPTISVQAQLPGAAPRVMASTVATPLERRLGQIAGVSELTSQSSRERTQITIQFDLKRNIDGAARDVQAAINAAYSDLPTTLRSRPTYTKQNPSNAPIMILSLTSETLSRAQIYDAVSLKVQQKLSQIEGVGEASLQGGSLPAVRVEMNPRALNRYGIGLEDVRAALAGANANQPKGLFSAGGQRRQIYANDQAYKADDYRNLVIAVRGGSTVRLSDVADVVDGPENLRNIGLSNGVPAIVVRIQAAPGANIVSTVDRIKAVLPELRAELAPIDLHVQVDRTLDIRGSLVDVERTLLISIVLVVLVVLLFLRNGRATLIPAVAVVVSLLGTLSIMYLAKFSLDNLSLMALTVATGFVVDDAIVVLENITRHVEEGMPRMQAALKGSAEVGFTVVSMSVSLIAVFIPILLMGGIVGRLFREFAVTLSAAILISLVVSLTTTPMMAARLVDERPTPDEQERRARRGGWRGFLGKVGERMEAGFAWITETYEDGLAWSLDHGRLVLLLLFATVCLNVYLYGAVAKGFFPNQDVGLMQGFIQVDQASSFAATSDKFKKLTAIVQADPAVQTSTAFQFGGSGGFMFVALKPKAERGGLSTDEVITRLRPKTATVSGAQLFLNGAQDFRAGGRSSNATYQYTLESDDLDALKLWSQKLTDALKKRPELTDVNNDQQERGLETFIQIDRDAASRLGLTNQQIVNTLRDAYSSTFSATTIFNALNQYRVIMEVDPRWAQDPAALEELYVTPGAASGYSAAAGPVGVLADAGRASAATVAANAATAAGAVRPAGLVAVGRSAALNGQTATVAGPAGPTAPGGGAVAAISSGGTGPALNGAGGQRSTTGGSIAAQTGSAVSTAAGRAVPLASFATYAPGATATSVNHQGQSVATTVSFNLPTGQTLQTAQRVIEETQGEIGMPSNVIGRFAGTAQQFNDTLKSQPLLILTALLTVYLVLGVLYESYIHPITVLSTLPSAGVGALLSLMLFKVELDIIALIGIILLIGIVKKNAILIIDFALVAERDQGLSSRDAIFQASLLRFRPILMTTLAAILGAVPLALGLGEGGELRRPLGIAIIGGLVASQVLTLITTPVVYLYMDKLRRRSPKRRGPQRWSPGAQGPGAGDDPARSPDPALVPRGTGVPAPQGS